MLSYSGYYIINNLICTTGQKQVSSYELYYCDTNYYNQTIVIKILLFILILYKLLITMLICLFYLLWYIVIIDNYILIIYL